MVLLSGGIDSATALCLTRRKYDVRALTFEYHGIAPRELQSAGSIAREARIAEHRVVRLPDLKEAADIAGAKFNGLPPTYIPLRNSIFYSFAASMAEETGARLIVGGHNKDDGRVFRDVSPAFFSSLQKAIRVGSRVLQRNQVRIIRPLGEMTKVEVVKMAARLEVPFSLTWSCHRSGTEHCWSCDGCRGRVDAFKKAGVQDPLMQARTRKIT